MQEIAWSKGGSVAPYNKREYGHARLEVISHPRKGPTDGGSVDVNAGKEGATAWIDGLFAGLSTNKITVWMSHGDHLDSLPEGFQVIATTETSPYAAIASEESKIFGIWLTCAQWLWMQCFEMAVCALR